MAGRQWQGSRCETDTHLAGDIRSHHASLSRFCQRCMSANQITLDGASRDVPREPSPFTTGTFSFDHLNRIKEKLARSPNLSEPASACRSIVLSAIVFGALLDRRAADAWLKLVLSGAVDPKAEWVDLSWPSTSGNSIERRWFIDPYTAVILRKSAGLFNGQHFSGRPQSASAAVAHEIGRHPGFDDDDVMQRFMDAARLWWQLNLPGVLVSYASGRISSRPVSSANWQRIVTGELEVVTSKAGHGSGDKGSTAKQAAMSVVQNIGFYTKLAKDCSIISGILGRAKKLQKATSHQSGPCYTALKLVDLETKFGRYLRDWVCECLKFGYDATGYETVSRRKPVAPSTLISATASLRNDVIYDLMRTYRNNPQRFVEIYDAAIKRASSPSAEASRARTYQRFHRWLVREAYYPSLKFEIIYNDHAPGGKAEVISEAEYHRAMAIASSTTGVDPSYGAMLRIALMLGFRCGLRPWEAVSVRVDDFERVTSTFELIVRPNAAQSLKTSNAKRILPLHLLLTENEQSEVLAGLRARTDDLRHRTSGAMLFPIPDDTPTFRTERTEIYGDLDTILRTATGNPEATFYDLRHSFASYLLTTLLLPPNVAGFPYGTVGPDCISQARRQRLHAPLLGYSLARSALYAISFLMGHAGPHRVLASYSHLLDWSLDGYVRHARHFLNARALPPAFPTAMRPASAVVQPSPGLATGLGAQSPILPGWRALSKALAKIVDGGSLAFAAAKYDIDPDLLDQLSRRLQAVLAIKTSQKRQRHRLVATDYEKTAQFGVPRLDEGLSLIDRVWQTCQQGQGGSLGSPEALWALETFLRVQDPARCDVPLETAQGAIRYALALETIGFIPELIKVRYQWYGTSTRTGWLPLPSPMTDVCQWDAGRGVSRFRIAAVSGSGDQASATSSYRFAMTLAALVSGARIPAAS